MEEKWIKRRHSVVVKIVKPFFKLFFKLKYNFSYKEYTLPKEGAFIICNHTSTMDPFFLSCGFDKNIYFMMSSDVFQKGFISKVIKYLINPIPKDKSNKSDIRAIRDSIKVAKENGNICVFPEGNRTFNGKLGNVDISISKLVKLLKKPLIICNIVGGYPSDPRWSNKRRKGKVELIHRKVLTYDEYKDFTNEELYQIIIDNLKVDDYSLMIPFKGKRKAEYLESILYICPICHKKHQLSSYKNYIKCNCCSNEIEYCDDMSLKCKNEQFKFKYIYEWYDFQIDYIKKENYENKEVIYEDKMLMFEPLFYQKRKKIGEGKLSLYNDSFVFSNKEKEIVMNFNDISAVTLLGRKKMNIYYLDKVYQFYYDRRTNLLKYMHLFYVIKNKKEGIENGFIGI